MNINDDIKNTNNDININHIFLQLTGECQATIWKQ